MFHDNRRERVVQEFLELTRKFPELSEPVYEKAIACIEECLGQVRRTHQQPLIGDTLQSQLSEDVGDAVSGYSLVAPAHTQRIVLRDNSLNQRTEEVGADALQEPVPIGPTTGPRDMDQESPTEVLESIGRGSPSNLEHHSVEQTPQHVQEQDRAQEQDQDQERAQEQGQEQRPLKRKPRADPDCLATKDETSGRMPRTKGQRSCTGYDKPSVRPTRQAALQAKESLSGHSASHFPMKRRRYHRATSKDPKDLTWLESQLGDATALAMTRELVNNWDRFSKTVLPADYRPALIVSQPAGSPPSNLLSLFAYLGRQLSTSTTECWASSIVHRTQCAHFHRVYTIAVVDAGKGEQSSFFRLSDELLRRYGQNPIRKQQRGHNCSAAVRDRLVDIIFLDPEQCPQISRDQCRKRIDNIDQDGRQWDHLIQTMGYEVLLLLPPIVTDTSMKLTKMEMDLLVPAWESRLSRLDNAYLAEVKEAMKVTFIPFIQSQLEIFDHEGGFWSLSSFAMQGSDSLGQPSSHTVTHEASVEEETAGTARGLNSHSTIDESCSYDPQVQDQLQPLQQVEDIPRQSQHDISEPDFVPSWIEDLSEWGDTIEVVRTRPVPHAQILSPTASDDGAEDIDEAVQSDMQDTQLPATPHSEGVEDGQCAVGNTQLSARSRRKRRFTQFLIGQALASDSLCRRGAETCNWLIAILQQHRDTLNQHPVLSALVAEHFSNTQIGLSLAPAPASLSASE